MPGDMPGDMPVPAKLYLFGGFRLVAPGPGPGPGQAGWRPVRIESVKGCALLAYLSSLGRVPASRERLSLLLWSDSDSRRARQNLRQVLFKLRRVLERHELDILRVDEQGVRLSPDGLRVDACEFDRLLAESTPAALSRALDLYSGEFLQDLSVDAPVFADWIAGMRAQYQSRAALCTASLLVAQRRAGQTMAALATARRALEIDPCQEDMHREVMSLCAEAGMQGAALNQYRVCRDILRRELDVEPDRATQDLYQSIQKHRAVQEPAAAAAVRAPGTRDHEPALAEAREVLAECERQYRRGEREAAGAALDRLIAEADRRIGHRPGSPSFGALDTLRHRAGILRAAILEASGNPAAARDRLRALERRRGGGAGQEIDLSYALSRTLCATGEAEEGLRYARRVLRLAAQSKGTAAPWYLAERLLFRLHLFAPRLDDMIKRLAVEAAGARERGDRVAAGEILAAQAMLEGYYGRTALMEASFESAHRTVARLADPRASAMLLQIEGLTRVWARDGQNAIDALDRALARATKTGDVIRGCVLRGLRGRAHLPLGRWDEARAALLDAIALSHSLDNVPYLPVFHAWLAEAEFRAGHGAAGLANAHRAWRMTQRQPWAWNCLPLMRALFLAHANAKRPNAKAVSWAARQVEALEASLGISHNSGARPHVRMAVPQAGRLT